MFPTPYNCFPPNRNPYIPPCIYDIRQNMTANNLSPNTNIGGATNSVPQINPVFSYHVDGGDIYVYLFKSEVGKFAVITFDNTSDEWAFAIQTLTSNSQYEADELVKKAYKEAVFFSDNPFRELLDDDEAMGKLAGILAEFYNSE